MGPCHELQGTTRMWTSLILLMIFSSCHIQLARVLIAENGHLCGTAATLQSHHDLHATKINALSCTQLSVTKIKL